MTADQIKVLCETIFLFGGGFIVGNIFGITLIALMHSASNDSRERERMEDAEQNDITTE